MFQSARQVIRFARVAVVQPFVAYLESIGVPTEKYLLQVGLTKEMLDDPDNPIPTSLVFDFLNAACQAEGIDDIGLLAGWATTLQMMDEFGNRLLTSKSIGDYLKLGCHLIKNTSSGDECWLAEGDKDMRFCHSISTLNEKDRIQNYLYTSLVTINTIRQASNQTWCPTEITVPGIGPDTAARLAAVLPGTRVIREGPYASFLIPRKLLALPMLAKDERVPDVGLHPQTLPLPNDFATSMMQLIETLIIAGNPDIHTAASTAGLSYRMLQRRLADSGTNYSALLAKTRIGMAMRWIRDRNRSLADIASTLGYTDQANFSRAFRRVTGLSPRAYRDSIH
ncbi:MAG: helix-turn-helix domain-containing protein [Lysobacterales bacterium]